MRRLSMFSVILLAVASMAWVAGCRSPEGPATSSAAGELLTREEQLDFNDPYGGYNMKDEAPGFGDPAMLSEFDANQEFNDPIGTDPEVAALAGAERNRLFLMITWGNLHRDSTIAHTTDWSGSLTVDPGVILLKEVIRFEPDDRILPRTQRDLLEWQSMTVGGIDGILVRVIPRPSIVAGDSLVDSSQTFIDFTAGAVSANFTLADLPGLSRVIELDDGNAVAFKAVVVPPGVCPHGFLRGVWHNHPERPGGFFHGHWATPDGKVLGFIRGIYGVNENGEKVLFGKMISRNGRFEGIVIGRWGDSPERPNIGWFEGRWVDRNLRVRGGVKGEWNRSAHCNGGFFRGIWAMKCDG